VRAEDAQELAERWCTCAAWTFWLREPWAPAVPLTSGEREVWAADLMHLPGAVAVRTRDGMPLVTVARLVTGTWRRLSPVWSHLLAADDHPLSVLGLQLWHATHRSTDERNNGCHESPDPPAVGR